LFVLQIYNNDIIFRSINQDFYEEFDKWVWDVYDWRA
jgi:hypothetical protein